MSDEKRTVLDEFLKRIGAEDPAPSAAFGRLQWKGTEACIDLRCSCGYLGHVDGEFFYTYRCRGCGKSYAVGSHVRLIPLTDDEVKWIAESDDWFQPIEDTTSGGPR